MANETAIAWTDATFNPWVGCTRVGPGCDACYAESFIARRLGQDLWGAGKPRRRTKPATWRQPLLLNEKARADGRRRKLFVASLADVFDNEVDEAWRADLWELVAQLDMLDVLLVTKRVGNARRMIPPRYDPIFRQRVWVIATAVNDEEFDRDAPKLRHIPARFVGISAEPQLGPIRMGRLAAEIDWVICGGESAQRGADARPFELDWARSLSRQCADVGTAFFFKQTGSRVTDGGAPARFSGKGDDPAEWPPDLRVREWPRAAA